MTSKTTLGTSSTRHNLNKLTAKKMFKAGSIQATEIDWSGKCKSCGAEIPTTVDECLSCILYGPPEDEEK